MSDQDSVLLLVGSAKQQGSSTSESLGNYLCERLADHGYTAKTMHVHSALRTEQRVQRLLEAVDDAELIVLAVPLYVDSLPYLVTQALERIAAHRNETAVHSVRAPRFVAVINCGFPEAHHNDVALAICRQFAANAGLVWAGGLSLGGGGFVGGVPLEQRGRSAQGIRRALELSATSLAAGSAVPQEAAELIAKPVIPARLYATVGDIGWHVTAWRQGIHRHLYDRPFEI